MRPAVKQGASCFAFETHDDISVREFARISHYATSTSYQKLNDYVALEMYTFIASIN